MTETNSEFFQTENDTKEAIEDTSGDDFLHKLNFSAHSRIKQIWAIGGGKGGVGKSLISSNLALSLARQGNKVIAVDLDLGGANLHTSLGIDLPKVTLSDFFSNRVPNLNDCITTTSIPNLGIISGAQDAIGITNLSSNQKAKLLSKVKEIDADYLIFDLGAGTNFHTLDFFILADVGIFSILPEPTSIENGYRFIKSTYYRKLWLNPRLRKIRPLVEAAMDPKNNQDIKTPSDLFKAVNRLHPDMGVALKEEIEKIQPKLILNQIRTQMDVEIGFSIKSVCKKYFGIDVDYVGYLDYDSSVWQTIRRKRPLLLEFPNSRVSTSIERITNYILKRYGHVKNIFL